MTLGSADDIDHLVLGEHVSDRHALLEVAHGPLNLVFDGAAVELDLQEICLLLGLAEQLLLWGKETRSS